MTPEKFVSSLIEAVHESSVSDMLNELATGPAGRRPPARLKQLSAWYRDLPATDQARLRQVVELAVHSTLFGTLCVLDGVRPIGVNVDLQIFMSSDEGRERLNKPDAEDLHNLYQASIYGRVFGEEA